MGGVRGGSGWNRYTGRDLAFGEQMIRGLKRYDAPGINLYELGIHSFLSPPHDSK